MSLPVLPPDPVGSPVARFVTSSAYGPGELWFTGLVAGAAGPRARACVEGVQDALNLGPHPRIPGLLRVLQPALPELTLRGTYSDEHDDSVLFGDDRGRAVLVVACDDVARFAAWGPEHGTADELAQAVRRALPRAKAVVSDVPMVFWRGDDPGNPIACDVRDVACPELGEILDNYPHRVRQELLRLAGLERPDALGRIVLWYGPPGTGKTHAVRALARVWSERGASVEVAVDPERLMTSAHYLHEVLLSDRRVRRRRARRAAPLPDGGEHDQRPERPLRVILLEDAAELFAAGCRETAGFSRFLNLTDGILGQGTRVIFVLTTNEDIRQLDPALSRPGRCLHALEFVPFEPEDAAAWLAAHGVADAGSPRRQTLSELFAIANSAPATVVCSPSRLGF